MASYIGPCHQLVAKGQTWDPIREALTKATPLTLPEPPPGPEEIRSLMPPGWSYLGPRPTPKGILWEAQHKLGVAFGGTPGELIQRIRDIQGTLDTTSPNEAGPSQGFNRRRKRRTRRDRDLVRCQVHLCQGLFWPDQKQEHMESHHPGQTLEVLFKPVNWVSDDDTGDDLKLDDPAFARSVEAED